MVIRPAFRANNEVVSPNSDFLARRGITHQTKHLDLTRNKRATVGGSQRKYDTVGLTLLPCIISE